MSARVCDVGNILMYSRVVPERETSSALCKTCRSHPGMVTLLLLVFSHVLSFYILRHDAALCIISRFYSKVKAKTQLLKRLSWNVLEIPVCTKIILHFLQVKPDIVLQY